MFPKKDPSKGVAKAPTWTCEQWKDGGCSAGWLEGPVLWLETHHYFVTVPCHNWLTGGALKCPHCERHRPTDESCYLAWLDESGKPYCSTLKSYARPILAKLKQYDPIALGKGKRKTDPLWVKPRSGSYHFTPTPGTARTQQQFEQWLLRLWKAPDLLEYFARDEPDLRPITETPGAESRREQSAEQFREWAARQGGVPQSDAMGPVSDAFPRLRALADKPATNGQHE